MTRKINTGFDDHDYEQLVLLAKLNRVSVTELVRRLCKAHLDRNTTVLRAEMAE